MSADLDLDDILGGPPRVVWFFPCERCGRLAPADELTPTHYRHLCKDVAACSVRAAERIER